MHILLFFFLGDHALAFGGSPFMNYYIIFICLEPCASIGVVPWCGGSPVHLLKLFHMSWLVLELEEVLAWLYPLIFDDS